MSFPISAIRFQFIRKFIFTMLYLFMEQFNPTLPEQESAYPPNNNKCYKTYSHTPSNYFFKPMMHHFIYRFPHNRHHNHAKQAVQHTVLSCSLSIQTCSVKYLSISFISSETSFLRKTGANVIPGLISNGLNLSFVLATV